MFTAAALYVCMQLQSGAASHLTPALSIGARIMQSSAVQGAECSSKAAYTSGVERFA
jgi:hypothetical protein